MRIRALTYPDLPNVLAVERRVFPTPWSLAMFVLELSKQTGICLAATERTPPDGDGGAYGAERLIGYLICSRYDTVWHIMNVAVDLDRQRGGIASRLLCELYARVGDTVARGQAIRRATRSRCGARMRSRSIFMSARAFARPARGGATTRTTARTRW